MLRRTLILAALALPLAGCVTYEVVERRVYHEDGRVTRSYDPYDDGRRYEDRYRHGGDDGRSSRIIVIERPAPVVYGGWGWGAPAPRWHGGGWTDHRPRDPRYARHPRRDAHPAPRPEPGPGSPRPVAPGPSPMPAPMPLPEPPQAPPPAPEVRVPEPEVPQGPRAIPTHIE